MGCVYRLIAPNGKSYVGYTQDLVKRIKEHTSLAKTSGDYLIHRAIRKYGWDQFRVEVLFESNDLQKLKSKEIEKIVELDTHVSSKRGYNLTRGGDGVLGHRHSPQTKEKLRLSHLGKKLLPETKRKIAEAHRGRKNTPEHNRNISLAMMGHPSYKKSGTPCKESTREKLSKIMQGKKYPSRKPPPPITEEHRQKLREGQARRRAKEQEEKRNASGTSA
jgi:group I intron endonuclease